MSFIETYLGIHAGDIDNAWKAVQDEAESLGLDGAVPMMEDRFREMLPSIDAEGFTDNVIDAMFTIAEDEIRSYIGANDADNIGITWEANGMASTFSIDPGDAASVKLAAENGEEYLFAKWLLDQCMDEDEAKEVLRDKSLTGCLAELIDAGGELLHEDSEEEFDRAEHEGACSFLIRNFKENYGGPKDICFKLESGRVFQASL